MTGVDEEIPQAGLLLGGGAATSIVSTSKYLTRIIQAPPIESSVPARAGFDSAGMIISCSRKSEEA